MRFERRDFDDWFHSRRLPERIPLALMMLLALAAGLGLGAIIIRGGAFSPASREGLEIALAPPPGGEAQQTAAASDVVPLPMEEMTVIEPIQATEPQITEADLRVYERAIWQEVNRRREIAGLKPLLWDANVATIARAHSEDEALRNYYAHVDPEGRGPAQRFGRSDVAENGMLIEYYAPPLQVDDTVNSWWNSQGHRASMLSAWSQRTGIGVAIEGNVVYITQNFLP